MIVLISEIALICLALYTVPATIYNLFLAMVYFTIKRPEPKVSDKVNRFAILVPAHNEELLIASFCESIENIDYPIDHREVFIIADNCSDKTAEICSSYPVTVLSRFDDTDKGKGYALRWALEKIKLEDFDAVLVIDADTTGETKILHELNKMINSGEQSIQCNIKIPNRNETWFTQLIFVSRTINNLLFHDAKYKLGLSSYLMGSGMCFKSTLLQEKKWTAFTLSEDWEYFAQLIEYGVRTAFAANAIVFQQESRSLQQATSQRLRWASGRFYVIKNLGMKLFLKGLRKRKLMMFDASLALMFPNWSLQINLIAVMIICAVFLPGSTFSMVLLWLGLALAFAQAVILAAGVALSGQYFAVLKAMTVAPLFLIWKFGIDLLCVTGLYGGKSWIRTKRHIPDKRP